MIVQTFEMDFPNQKIERHLDQDHSVLPRGRQAVSFLTFMSSSLVKEKKRCQTDTDSWHIPVPDTFQEDVGNSGEIKWMGKLLDVQGSTVRQNELLLRF